MWSRGDNHKCTSLIPNTRHSYVQLRSANATERLTPRNTQCSSTLTQRDHLSRLFPVSLESLFISLKWSGIWCSSFTSSSSNCSQFEHKKAINFRTLLKFRVNLNVSNWTADDRSCQTSGEFSVISELFSWFSFQKPNVKRVPLLKMLVVFNKNKRFLEQYVVHFITFVHCRRPSGRNSILVTEYYSYYSMGNGDFPCGRSLRIMYVHIYMYICMYILCNYVRKHICTYVCVRVRVRVRASSVAHG